MKQEIDNNAMWAAFRQELALQGELHVIAAIDNALNNLGFTIKETNTIIPIPLEQGEHAKFRNSIQVGDKVTRNQDGVLVNLSQLKRVAKKDEKQGEQKSIEYPLCKTVKDKIDYYIVNHFTTDTVVKTDVNSIVKAMKEGVMIGMSEQKPADTVEHKFKVGDRIIDKSFPKNVFTVTEIINDGIAYVDEDGERFTKYYDEDDWDEYELVEQKPVWSEEDYVKINRIVACLENLNVADNDILLKDVAWLKSLKERYTWKPSDEQMDNK